MTGAFCLARLATVRRVNLLEEDVEDVEEDVEDLLEDVRGLSVTDRRVLQELAHIKARLDEIQPADPRP